MWVGAKWKVDHGEAYRLAFLGWWTVMHAGDSGGAQSGLDDSEDILRWFFGLQNRSTSFAAGSSSFSKLQLLQMVVDLIVHDACCRWLGFDLADAILS
jgi:hypothetical protein